ncbi:MAG: LamG-like jellyroll fold domain-containing protein [Planctomycetota bacterium]|jgi:hypothetical protein
MRSLQLRPVQFLVLTGLLALASSSVTVGAGEPAAAGEPVIDKPLLAHWTFNEPGEAAPVHDSSDNPGFGTPVESKVSRTRGVFGSALRLRGGHALRVAGSLAHRELAQITFSAWTRPTELGGFREIFRQECPNRLLFSFQESGSILSLGLNIGGYVECDARINPARGLDGGWHHCAATFDGDRMRVYLDGKEVNSLHRPGKISIDPNVPGFIGSSGGTGEHFQGTLDDLRIYEEALTSEQIASLYSSGLRAIENRSKELEQKLAALYAPGDSFAATLADSRGKLLESNLTVDDDLVLLLLAKLKARFPKRYETFINVTGISPATYLASGNNEFYAGEAERLMGLLVEYMPLTECQWEQQTRSSPQWIEILLEAGRRIEHRPRVAEAVAPYVKPSTPETRSLTADEARAALRRDWLHQADQVPGVERIKQEIAWARHLAERIESDFPDKVDFAREIARLKTIEEQAAALTGPGRELYFQVREAKRAIMFRNPVIDFDKVLFVDMPFPAGSEWPHQTRHRLGYMAVPGGRLLVLKGLSPAGELSQLMPQPALHGSFWRPDVSYDATKVLFCFKPHNEKSFHLYEINVDGSGLVQLTDGKFDDFDPVYLPDGKHIIFSTTRAHTYVRCMPPTNAFVLARCDRDGKNVYLISYNNEPDYLPSVMNDGRIIYTRWEYTDKPLWRAQALWSVNPDGTQVSVYWGNQSVWPDLLKDARSIPNSRRVMFTGSAHHNWFSGSVGIIDPDEGFNFPHGLTKVTADVPWPESGNGPTDPAESPDYHGSGRYVAYYSPYPLSERDFLVSANRGGKFVLYLMDVDGNRELIYEGTHNIFHAVPLKPRQRPPVISDRVVWPDRENRLNPQPGVIYSNNVYEGTPAELHGKAKFLRVLHIDDKTYTYWYKRPYASTGPVVSIVQSEGVKRVIGTVPIEEDGSVAFLAPPNKALHFQLLDGNYRALQTMRSFAGVMPGERRGCLGCHELHSRTPERFEARSLAARREPPEITPPPWGDDTVGYTRYVQPVLDKYCGECHQGDGEARETLDLTLRPGWLMFNEPYVTLTGKPSWGQPYRRPENPPPGWGIANMLMVEGYDQRDPKAYQTPAPMTALSYKSRLIDLASSGEHYDVRVDPVSLRRLIAWVDSMCPFRGDEEVREIPDPEFQGVDWLAIRPRIKTAPRIVRPGPVD